MRKAFSATIALIALLAPPLVNNALSKQSHMQHYNNSKNYNLKEIEHHQSYQQNQKAITLSDVMKSVWQNYPKVLEAMRDVDAAEAEALKAQKPFNTTVSQNSFKRMSGYYDGEEYDQKIEKLIPFFNTKVYAGYRRSDGEFPIYEQRSVTNSAGESRFGFSTSLLKDSTIDENRLNLRNSKLEIEKSTFKLNRVRLAVQNDAIKAYWSWVASGLILQIQEDLLSIAKQRDVALTKKVENGDIAEIFKVENLKNIYKRESQLASAQRNVKIMALKLSLFFRDSQANQIIPEGAMAPSLFPAITPLQKHLISSDTEKALAARPEIKILNNEIAQLQNELKLGSNTLQPELNVSLETSRDKGQGSITRQKQERIGMLNFKFPLERSQGKGMVAKANASLKKISYQKQLTTNIIENEVKYVYENAHAAMIRLNNAILETKLAIQLEEAERKRFYHGDSDFFVLNMREENTADAKMREVEANLMYQESLADYYSAIGSLQE